jgi:hypothetical protein
VGHREDSSDARNDLTGEHRFSDMGQLVLAISFGEVYVVDSFILHRTTCLNHALPRWLQVVVGFELLTLAGYLAESSGDIVFARVRGVPREAREARTGRAPPHVPG